MKPRCKLLRWFFLGTVALLIMAIALAGCDPGGVTPPAEEATGGVTPPAEETAGGVAPAEEEVGGGVAPQEEEAVGGVAPAEEEAAGGVTPPEEETAGGVVPPEEEEAGEATPPLSPEVVSVDIVLEVASTNPDGMKFIAPETGSYTLAIVGGASRHLPETDPNWPIYGGWRTRLVLYINKPVEWGDPAEWGPQPINFDYKLGSDEAYPAPAEAEEANQGASVTVHLDKDDYIIALEHDHIDYYDDNSGTMKIRITGPCD